MTGFRLHLFQNEQVLDYTVAQLTFPLFQNDQSSYIFYSEMNRVQTFSFQKVSCIPKFTEFQHPLFNMYRVYSKMNKVYTLFIPKCTEFQHPLFQHRQSSNFLYSRLTEF